MTILGLASGARDNADSGRAASAHNGRIAEQIKLVAGGLQPTMAAIAQSSGSRETQYLQPERQSAVVQHRRADARGPTIVPPQAAVSAEISPLPKRRTFSAAAKLRIFDATDRANGIAAVLRREGLYSSALTDWRRQRAAGAFEAPKPLRHSPKPVAAQPAVTDPANCDVKMLPVSTA
jgi:transposase-like protein